MRRALEAAGVHVETFTDLGGVHGLPDEGKRIEYFKRVRAFIEDVIALN